MIIIVIKLRELNAIFVKYYKNNCNKNLYDNLMVKLFTVLNKL